MSSALPPASVWLYGPSLQDGFSKLAGPAAPLRQLMDRFPDQNGLAQGQLVELVRVPDDVMQPGPLGGGQLQSPGPYPGLSGRVAGAEPIRSMRNPS